jgi:hypothetical protein
MLVTTYLQLHARGPTSRPARARGRKEDGGIAGPTAKTFQVSRQRQPASSYAVYAWPDTYVRVRVLALHAYKTA